MSRRKKGGVEEDSVVAPAKKAESKRRLTNHLQARPSREALVERGILSSRDQKKAAKAAKKQQKKDKKKWKKKGGSAKGPSTIIPVIGIPLALLADREQAEVPMLVTECIQYLRAQGLGMEGLFRVAGEKPKVDALRSAFETGAYTTMEATGVASVPAVTSLLKLFFRSLPEPLFTFELHEKFISTVGSPSAVQEWAKLTSVMPRVHRNALMFLFPFLVEVAAQSATNKMDPSNVGIVFGPTLLRSLKEFNTGEVDLSNRAQHVVEGMVANWAQLERLITAPPTAAGNSGSRILMSQSTPTVPPPAHRLPPPVSMGMSSPGPPPAGLPPPQAHRRSPSTGGSGSGISLPPPRSLTTAPRPASLAAHQARGNFTQSSPSLAVSPTPAPAPGQGTAAVALYNFTGNPAKGQIDLVANAPIIVYEDHASGWSSGECNGKRGYFPSQYARRV